MIIEDLITKLKELEKENTSSQSLDVLVNENEYITEIKKYKVFYNTTPIDSIVKDNIVRYAQDYIVGDVVTDEDNIEYEVIEVVIISTI